MHVIVDIRKNSFKADDFRVVEANQFLRLYSRANYELIPKQMFQMQIQDIRPEEFTFYILHS